MDTMKLLILSVLVIGSSGAPAHQTLSVNDDGTYQFSYETGSEGGSHFRTETKGPDGAVIGKYSYKDPTGELRVVNYRADETGFLASEDGEIPQPSASEVKDAAEGSEQDEKPKDETKASLTADEDEEEKPLKLEEPIDNGPPEGFPIGFFNEQFSGLRRLPEPKKEEKATEKKAEGKVDEPSTDDKEDSGKDAKAHLSALWQPEAFPPGFFLHHFTGLRRLEEPVKEEESPQTIDDTKSYKPDTGVAHIIPGHGAPSSYILPFPSLTPHPWPAPSHHQPVYVYSHQQPNAYSYGYYY